jgi:hypothetical protein
MQIMQECTYAKLPKMQKCTKIEYAELQKGKMQICKKQKYVNI